MSRSEDLGKEYDKVLIVRRRLAIAHLAFALSLSFAMWTNRLPYPMRSPLSRGGGSMMVLLSVWGWAPFLVSWVFSRQALGGKSGAANAFIFFMAVCAVLATLIFHNWFRWTPKPQLWQVAISLTAALIVFAEILSLVSEGIFRIRRY